MNFNEAIAAGGVSQEEAKEIFDSLEPTDIDFLIGTWRGAEFPSGHPGDNLLAASGWYGKQFKDQNTVAPLLYCSADRKSFFSADPVAKAEATRRGITNISSVRAEVETDRPSARMRLIEYRGVVTVAMIYDQRPIIDYFRKVDANTVLGAMDMRDDDMTYFFVLRRDS